MTTFLLIAVFLALGVSGLIAWPLIGRRAAPLTRDDADLAFYRDQLTELDRDVARGLINEDEAEGARAEIARRLIAASRSAGTEAAPGTAPRGRTGLLSFVTALFLVGVSSYLYFGVDGLYRKAGVDIEKLRADHPLSVSIKGRDLSVWDVIAYKGLGSPGRADLPLAGRPDPALAARPTQEEAELAVADDLPPPRKLDPEYAKMVAQLEEVVAARPDDIRGNRLLATELARSGRWVEARQAYDRLLGLLGPKATAEDLADAAGAMVFAAGGYVSPRAAKTIDTALAIDRSNPMARFYLGFRLRQSGRPAEAAEVWEALLAEDQAAEEPRGAQWQSGLSALIAETRELGVPGPTREDVEAANRMSADERAAFIANMVAGLEARLQEQNGTPEEWVRLITAYMQLKKPQDARRILALSQERLDDQTARAFVRERALLLGLDGQ